MRADLRAIPAQRTRQYCGQLTLTQDSKVLPATAPIRAKAWTLNVGAFGQCPSPPTHASQSLRTALATADLDGKCITEVTAPPTVDVHLQRRNANIGVKGATRSTDTQTVAYLREGDSLRLVYRPDPSEPRREKCV